MPKKPKDQQGVGEVTDEPTWRDPSALRDDRVTDDEEEEDGKDASDGDGRE